MIKATLPRQDSGRVRPDAGSSADLDLRVMIVVADPSMGTFLQSFVAARGYGTIVLADAEDAIMHYEAERPAAVVLDLVSLGAMDGLDALAAFKKIDHEVPVIVLSVYYLLQIGWLVDRIVSFDAPAATLALDVTRQRPLGVGLLAPDQRHGEALW